MSSGGPVRVSTHRKNFVVKFVFLRFTFVPHKQVLRKPHASDAEHEARRERKREKPHVDNFLGIQLHPDVSIVYARYAKLESLQTHVAVSSACMVLHMMRGMHRITSVISISISKVTPKFRTACAFFQFEQTHSSACPAPWRPLQSSQMAPWAPCI